MQGHSNGKRSSIFRLQNFPNDGKRSMWLPIGHRALVIAQDIVGGPLRLSKVQTFTFWDQCVVLPATSSLIIQNIRSKWPARFKSWRAKLPNHSAAWRQKETSAKCQPSSKCIWRHLICKIRQKAGRLRHHCAGRCMRTKNTHRKLLATPQLKKSVA